MADSPEISVIMSVFNGEKYLREAMDSILNQSYADFEFIIVNDGSTDNSLSIIQGYADRRIRVIANEQNIGLTRSLNKAIKQARGEYIARQDADDISLPNRFEEQIKYFKKNPNVALLGTGIYRIDGKGKILGKTLAVAKPGKSLLKQNQFNHGSTMFKSRVVRELGGYNELFSYCQDYELWLRMAKNYAVRNLPQILYKLRFHNEAVRFRKRDEAILYNLLALRLVRDECDAEVLKAIKDKGIKGLRSYLTRDEKIIFHKSFADLHMQQGNLKLAKEEYKKACRLAPLDIENDLKLIRLYLGRSMMANSYKIYEAFRNFYVGLKNRFSR